MARDRAVTGVRLSAARFFQATPTGYRGRAGWPGAVADAVANFGGFLRAYSVFPR
jgi:hypothetical protein